MPRYDYKTAVEKLSEVEKNRILACYLSIENPNPVVDWDHATAEFGAASVESMKVMVRTALKKVKDAGGSGDAPAVDNAPITPKSNKGGRKRKDIDADTTGDSGDAVDGATDTPKTPRAPKAAKKPRTTKAKVKQEVKEEEDLDGMNMEEPIDVKPDWVEIMLN